MNKNRRKAIAEIRAQLEGLQVSVEELRDEEQEYYDNMPDSLRDGDKGTVADEAINSLSSAYDSLQTAIDDLESAEA